MRIETDEIDTLDFDVLHCAFRISLHRLTSPKMTFRMSSRLTMPSFAAIARQHDGQALPAALHPPQAPLPDAGPHPDTAPA